MQLQLQQYRELAAFTQFGASDLDKSTLQLLRRGERVSEILKQPQYDPVPLHNEVAILYAATRGYLDDVPRDRCGDFERDLRRYMDTQARDLVERIGTKKEWDDDVENGLKAMLDEFKKAHPYSETPAAPAVAVAAGAR
jgi:F-type H+-transporting ATPase subunit alpha